MKRKTIGLIVVVAIIYISFVIGIGISVVNYYRKQFAKSIEETFLSINILDATQLSNRLNEDYEIFKEHINNSTNEELNLNKPHIYNQKYLGFGEIVGDGFIFDYGIKKTFKQDLDTSYFTQEISIYSYKQIFQNDHSEEAFFFFIHDNRFGFFSASKYLDSILVTDGFLLVNTNGLILFNGIKNNFATNLNGFYNKSDDIVKSLKKNESGISIDRVGSIDYMTSYSQVKTIDDLYFLEHLDYKKYTSRVDQLVEPIHAIILTFSIALVILSVFAGVIYTSIYRDVELSYHQLSYNTIPIVVINRKGRIMYRNKQFKRDFHDFAGTKQITEIFMVDMLEILKQIPLKVWLVLPSGPYNSARLNVIKTSIWGYTILVYPIIGIEQQEDFSLTNIHTGIESLNQYKEDFQNLKKVAKPSAKNQAVVCIRIINLRNVELMRGQSFVEEAVFKAAHRLRTLSYKPDKVRFYHSFDNTFVLFYESDDLLDIKEDVRRIIREFEEEKIDPVYDISFYLKAGIYEFNLRNERSGAIFVYEKAKTASEQLSQSVDSVLGVYDSASDRRLQLNYLIAHDLEKAITNRELYMALQPIYEVDKDQITGFEALLRWNNPKYRGISPQVLVEVANQSNFLLKLGDYILEESLEIAKKVEPYNMTLAINLDPLQLLQVGFVDILKNQLEKHDIHPKSIVFEITENNIITFFDDITTKLKEIRGLGIKIHIDDFGTGNSSLLYLKELPFDGLKIDREFIKDLETDRHSKAIVTMIVGLAKNLDVEIVAEGVETAYELDFLDKRNVKYIQGYYIGRPLPFAEAIENMEEANKKSKKK
ncbi:MAG: EAL domain-containing protein [Acholeplasmataceae bacterium]|jgi:EAL domain-containing protein (putative c-di-GMP-specific phosphodiesterase class I)